MEKLRIIIYKDLVERSCHELKRYQDRYGHHFKIKELDDNSMFDDPLIQYEHLRRELRLEDLEPLIVSYEDNIHELNHLV